MFYGGGDLFLFAPFLRGLLVGVVYLVYLPFWIFLGTLALLLLYYIKEETVKRKGTKNG